MLIRKEYKSNEVFINIDNEHFDFTLSLFSLYFCIESNYRYGKYKRY